MTADNNGWPDGPDDDHAECVHCGGQNFILPAALGAEVDRRVASIVAAREAAAWCAGRDAAAEFQRTTAREIRNKIPERFSSIQAAACRTIADTLDETAAAIRALPLPADFAAALEAVRREEREACARICEDHLETTKTTPHGIERMLTPKGALHGSSTGTVYAAAIRARGTEGGA